MRRRLAGLAAALSFAVLFALLIWQGSFRIEYSPTGAGETVTVWAVSTFIFLLTIYLAFMLFRGLVKAYIDRQQNREGSRIRSKLLAGAIVLTLAPAFFYVVFSFYVLNRHLDAWFGRPDRTIQAQAKELDKAYQHEAQARVQAVADWVALLPETRDAAETGHIEPERFRTVAVQHGIRQLLLERPGQVPLLLYQAFDAPKLPVVRASASVAGRGTLTIVAPLTADPSVIEEAIQRQVDADASRSRMYQDTYLRLIALITVFVFFVAAWAAQILSRQISLPISALLGAAQEVRRGNLSYRVRVKAMDELATLVRAFNEMTGALEANGRELEARRRFTEAILESIPTGVISVSPDERIEHVNRALSAILPGASGAKTLGELFSAEDLAEIRYVLKRARRMGTAGTQLEMHVGAAIMHLAVTAASLDRQRGFVVVLEDTSELLRAQKTLAWQEVARRIAHEIKNPLTPIALCAERIARHLKRIDVPEETRAILDECTGTIQQEVMSVKSLVDEFSQFSRFPTAKLGVSDLNEIVESAMAVFAGRLDGMEVHVSLDPSLQPVMADRELMKRVIVNLVDNAAEAMLSAPVRKLLVSTAQISPEVIELSVTDTGSGVSVADKEKLFLPYFSTKARGTGLGLAIVSRIITEHHGSIRVEDHVPSGARFVIELAALAGNAASTAETVETAPLAPAGGSDWIA